MREPWSEQPRYELERRATACGIPYHRMLTGVYVTGRYTFLYVVDRKSGTEQRRVVRVPPVDYAEYVGDELRAALERAHSFEQVFAPLGADYPHLDAPAFP